MKFITILICLFSLIFVAPQRVFSKNAGGKINSVAVIYGGNIPADVYHLYDWLVVNPGNRSLKTLKQKFYLKHTSKLIAYVSFGEADKTVSYYKNVKKYGIGKNKIWHSEVMNITKKGYRNFILDTVLSGLAKEGFKGFMFDTLDSYKLVANRSDWPAFQAAEVKFIKDVRKKFQGKIIIVNRGFSIMDKIHGNINGVIAEGIYKDLNDRLDYVSVSKNRTARMIARLDAIKKKYGLPIIAIDYVNPRNGAESENDARRIAKDGFIPWVTNKDLSIIGTSDFKFIKRRMIVICNSRFDENRPDPNGVRMVIEYLGFVPETFHVNGRLPRGFLADRYAGAVVVAEAVKKPERLYKWVRRAIDNGLKVFFVNGFGFPENDRFLNGLNIKVYAGKSSISDGYASVRKAKGSGFEVPLNVSYDDTYIMPKRGVPIVSVKNKYGQESVPFSIAPWGGYAIDNTLVNNQGLWVYNPFKIFKRIYLKKVFPVPDTTTENGRILLFSQIDGDADFGYTNFNPDELIVNYISKHIIERYKIPVTASVITADLMGRPYGLHLKRAKKLRKAFRRFFKYKNVEIASHTFSHPFNWPALVRGIYKKGYNLPVPGYKFSVRQEIIGSVNWINRRLAPKNKKVRVILWSGDCRPPAKGVRMAYDLGIYNVNGYDTSITDTNPFLRYVKPMGRNVGDFFQVSAAIANEDIYTNLWRGPFYGFENVIQTFKLTEKPYRLKPLYIYYHWYSGQKVASVRVLNKVYKWALRRHPIPEFVSQYAKKVLDFRSTAVAETGDGWIIRNSGNIRTLRVPASWGYPDMKTSRGVIGYRMINGREYIALSNSGNYYLAFSPGRPDFRLVESNGMVRFFKKTKNGYRFTLESNPYIPLHFAVRSASCKVIVSGKGGYNGTIKGDIFNYKFINGRKAYVKASCN